jgi:hypothetical protein
MDVENKPPHETTINSTKYQNKCKITSLFNFVIVYIKVLMHSTIFDNRINLLQINQNPQSISQCYLQAKSFQNPNIPPLI